MCGIFCYLLSKEKPNNLTTVLTKSFQKISRRGPDCQRMEATTILDPTNQKTRCDLTIGFHRLAIMDPSPSGHQPMRKHGFILVCNGEIYNYRKLVEQYKFQMNSSSDCEVILDMVSRMGMDETVRMLDGVFSFLLYHPGRHCLYVARDPFGVRPLFVGIKSNPDGSPYAYGFASEAKALCRICTRIQPFPPGSWWEIDLFDGLIEQQYQYYHYKYQIDKFSFTNPESQLCQGIRDRLTAAVRKRLMSDRPIGCLLSGGLDSSLISALVAREFKKHNKGELNTFSIGLPDSPDLYYAQKVAQHIGSKHHSVVVSEQEFLAAIPEVIYAIESYDTTTVRASTGNYLIGKYIKQNTDCTVIFNGDGSDEQSGYLYLGNAPSPQDFQQDCVRLLKEIHLFDVLRSDRSISSQWSLESRTPFLDKDFVDYYMSISPDLKMYTQSRMEKYLLRKAFDGLGLLPDEVLWRRKEAFSDGCSDPSRSWHSIIQEYVGGKISDLQLDQAKQKYPHNTPQLKESLYYRQIFEGCFGPKHANLIPHYWMPKWCGEQVDPSARTLGIYQATGSADSPGPHTTTTGSTLPDCPSGT